MKHITKIALIVIIISLLAVMLASCSLSQEEVAGVYVGNYTQDGNTFRVKIILTERGTYGKVTTKNNQPESSVSGYYDIEDDQILLYDSRVLSTYTEYRYSDDQLEKDGKIFTKQAVDPNDSNELPQSTTREE